MEQWVLSVLDYNTRLSHDPNMCYFYMGVAYISNAYHFKSLYRIWHSGGHESWYILTI